MQRLFEHPRHVLDVVDPPAAEIKGHGERNIVHARDARCVPRADVLVEWTLPVYQSTNDDAVPKAPCPSEVSHVEMWPYVASAAVASVSHASTAVLMLSVMTSADAFAGTDAGVGAQVSE